MLQNVGPSSTASDTGGAVVVIGVSGFPSPSEPSKAGAGAATGAGRMTRGAGGVTLSGAWMVCNIKQYRCSSAELFTMIGAHTEAKMTALRNPKKPGTSKAILALLSLIKPITTCALNIHESEIPKMTIVHTDIPDRTDGVLVDSI